MRHLNFDLETLQARHREGASITRWDCSYAIDRRKYPTAAQRSDGRPPELRRDRATITCHPSGRGPHDQETSPMPTGTVKWFNTTKGYGFIAPEDGSKDAFVHISAVERAGLGTLREGQRVTYELRPGRDGKSAAENLSVAD